MRVPTNRKWIVFIPVVILAVSLVSLLVIVPLVFADRFVSCSFELEYVAGPGYPCMEIVYVNGSVVPIVSIQVSATVTNSYFAPVQVRYNGFEFVWLIYNQTVDDPADIVGNKDHLIWGAFRTAYPVFDSPMYGFENNGFRLGNITGYEYYISRKDLTNYTKTIPHGKLRQYAFFYIFGPPSVAWYGQNLNGHPILPGTYYMYMMAYGRVYQTMNLTVTSILWPRGY